MPKQLQIFKPGTHTPESGRPLVFSEADLAATAAAYDPAKHEAPLVVGHPSVDAPAYGWVKSLSFADGIMLADPDQVDASFAELVNAGTFKKISASFYSPTAPNNPVPGVYYLRHVGFLGGRSPAVKGLKSASFAEAEEGVLSFGDYEDQVELGFWRRLKNWLIGKEGADTAEAMLPEYEMGILAREAFQPSEQSGSLQNFSEDSMDQKEIAEQKKTLDLQAADLAARETALKVQEHAQNAASNVSFAEGLISKGILLPAQKESVVALLSLSDGIPVTADFAEGKSQAEIFKEFLANQPKIVSFGEHAGAEEENAGTVSFAAPPGFTVDAAGLELHHKALAYQQKNPGVDYMTSVKACS
jgi:hypothetical protein